MSMCMCVTNACVNPDSLWMQRRRKIETRATCWQRGVYLFAPEEYLTRQYIPLKRVHFLQKFLAYPERFHPVTKIQSPSWFWPVASHFQTKKSDTIILQKCWRGNASEYKTNLHSNSYLTINSVQGPLVNRFGTYIKFEIGVGGGEWEESNASHVTSPFAPTSDRSPAYLWLPYLLPNCF